MKTKYGQDINPDDFPYAGQFGAYVRANIDPEWGMAKEREITGKRKFRVNLSAMAQVFAIITVNAESEEEAVELAKDKVSEVDFVVDDVADSTVEVLDVSEEDDED